MLPPGSDLESRSLGVLTVLTGAEAGEPWVVPPNGLVLGRERAANVVMQSSAISRRHAFVGAGPDGSFWIEDLGSTNGTFLGSRRVSWSPLASGDLIRLGPDVRLRFSVVDDSEAALRRQMYQSAVRDPLTSAFNRRYFMDRLVSELGAAQQSSSDTSVLLVDLDYLKTLNDELGHPAGDRALCSVASAITHAMRLRDVVARYGGDEFAVLAPGAPLAEAQLLADRLQRAVASRRFSCAGSVVELSVCVGAATYLELAPEAGAVELLALADARLYEAKRARPTHGSAIHGRLADGSTAASAPPPADDARRQAPTLPRPSKSR